MPTVHDLAGPAGRLEALLEEPDRPPKAAVVFAHPLPTHGGTMHTKVVYQGAKALARIGCEVLRFNFRGVGRSAGEWDKGQGELDDFRAAVDFMAARHPGLEIIQQSLQFRLVEFAAQGHAHQSALGLRPLVPLC